MPIHDILLTLVGVHDVQLLVFRRPPNYPDNFRLIVKHKLVSIQLGKQTNKILTLKAFFKSLPISSKRMYACRTGEGEGNGREKVKKKKKSSYPIARSPRSYFCQTYQQNVIGEPTSFSSCSSLRLRLWTHPLLEALVSCLPGPFLLLYPFKIVVSRLLISLTCNVRASIDDWQEY